MALQSSGPISIDDIRTELSSSSGSLRTLSAAAGKSTPDAMSEFYGYSNVDFSATVTTGVITYFSDTYSGYRIGFPGPIGSMDNTSFNGYTIGNLNYFDGTNSYIELTFTSGRIGFSNLTIGGTSYGSSSSWTAVGSNLWKYNTSTNPFGSSGTIVSVTAQY